MKLSEAMRQGWQGIERETGIFQSFRSPWDGRESPLVAACAIGAACWAVTHDPVESFGDARQIFPQLGDPIDPAAVEDGSSIYRFYGHQDGELRLSDVLVYYNDDTSLGKEEIIRRVEGLGY